MVTDECTDEWMEECTEAFQKIIHCLTKCTCVGICTRPHVLHVDASLNGLGAVLNQEYPERLRALEFASQKLKASEQHYPVHHLEFVALKWAVVDMFPDYFYGERFTIRTDNSPLTYILTTAKLNATGYRWLAALSTYNFSVQYRPGKSNIDADALSRNVFSNEEEQEDRKEMPPSGIKALCKTVNMQKCIEQLGVSSEVITECNAFPTRLDIGLLKQLSSQDLMKAREENPAISSETCCVERAVVIIIHRQRS